MSTVVVTPAQANLELVLWNAEAESVSSSDVYLWLRNSGLPSEVAIRLQGLVGTVADAGGKVVSVGKIILLRIIEFVKDHPNLAIGIAVGAAIGALVGTIPLLGVYLAPVATAISVTIGAIAGHRLDKLEKGQAVNTSGGLIEIGQDVIEIAKEFFKLLISVFNIIFNNPVGQIV